MTTPEMVRATVGVSYSGLNDFAVSPLRYWHKHLNPERVEEEPTPAQKFGTAVHAAVLQPANFLTMFCPKFDASAIEGCLHTIQDIRAWITDQGEKPRGTRKDEVIAQAQAINPDVPIFDVLEARYGAQHAGEIQFSAEDWARVTGAAESLRAEPRIAEMLADPVGLAEEPFLVEYKDVPLKAMMDWITPTVTLDLKTFTASRGKAIDRAVADAIWYEGYYRQAYLYSLIRSIAAGDLERSGPQKAPRFVLAFVESDPPHEVRLRELQPIMGGEVNLLWQRARTEVESAIDYWRELLAKFGIDKPWRYAQEIQSIEDVEFPALYYGR